MCTPTPVTHVAHETRVTEASLEGAFVDEAIGRVSCKGNRVDVDFFCCVSDIHRSSNITGCILYSLDICQRNRGVEELKRGWMDRVESIKRKGPRPAESDRDAE